MESSQQVSNATELAVALCPTYGCKPRDAR
jgi:hypothetical protein